MTQARQDNIQRGARPDSNNQQWLGFGKAAYTTHIFYECNFPPYTISLPPKTGFKHCICDRSFLVLFNKMSYLILEHVPCRNVLFYACHEYQFFL